METSAPDAPAQLVFWTVTSGPSAKPRDDAADARALVEAGALEPQRSEDPAVELAARTGGR